MPTENFHELNEYARSYFAMFITWFSFFVTINFVVAWMVCLENLVS